MVFSNISKAKNYNKTFIMGLGLGGFFVFLGALRNILVLGSERISMMYFPSIMVLSLIHIGSLIQRLEIGIVIITLVCVFVKAIICLFAVCNGISKVFGFDDYRFIATPVTLLMLSFSFFIFKSTMEISYWNLIAAPYYSFVFEVIIPLVIFIVAEIRSRNSATTT